MYSKPSLFPLVESSDLLAISNSLYLLQAQNILSLTTDSTPPSTWNHITKIMKAVHYFQTIFSHLQSRWHYHNSPHICCMDIWSYLLRFLSPEHLVAPPFTTLTPYWICSNSFATNPTWVPSPGLTAGSLPITINLVLVIAVVLNCMQLFNTEIKTCLMRWLYSLALISVLKQHSSNSAWNLWNLVQQSLV